MGKEGDLRIGLIFFIHPQHFLLHFRTNRRTGSEKEIRHIDHVGKSLIGNHIAVLVYKTEFWYAVMNGIPVHHFIVSKDRQRTLKRVPLTCKNEEYGEK